MEVTVRPITKLLIANRGEIASRIQRTCASMGIDTVAVFSEADADAPFVRTADEAVCIGPAPSAQSYLNVDAILGAARMTGADAVHPGFGFLAENAAFADAVTNAGLVFVGPSADAIRRMGSKRQAKQVARDAGVPVIEGYDGEDQAALADKARAIGFPVLIKASAGGGGKGMRVVNTESELDDGIAAARREALSAFADGTLLVEKYIERPRHIEIQILGDSYGALVHLHERECSIQRRHQKVIEEAPSLAVGPLLLRAMGEAALSVARAIGYCGAGTVEMILDGQGEFYFLEVNTRLQVEHPVTEAITDVDIVELQLRIAQGEPLPFDQELVDTLVTGAALECRLYAEDPARDFLPQSGTIARFDAPEAAWLRVDSGVESGSEVSVHYDPMLAKFITWGRTRWEAIARMRWALRRTSVFGMTTNRDFLLDVIEHPAFIEGALHTHFIDEHLPELDRQRDELFRKAAVFAALSASAARPPLLPTLRKGFRNNRGADQEVQFEVAATSWRVTYADLGRGSYRVRAQRLDAAEEVTRGQVVAFGGGDRGDGVFWIQGADGHRETARVLRTHRRVDVLVDGRGVALDQRPRFPEPDIEGAADGALAPMPGTIIEVLVAVGESVEQGQRLAVMEAMKMEHTALAPHAGVVAEVRVAAGDAVDEGQLLALVRAPEVT